MDDLVIARRDLCQRYAPLRRRGLLEHRPRRRSAATHRLEKVTHTARAIGVLVAEACFIALRLPHEHAAEVGLELIGDHHRQAGTHALPHLLAMAGYRHSAIGGDRDKHQRVIHPTVRHPVRAVLRLIAGKSEPRKADREDQADGGRHAQQ